jgi:prepilin-type N-terminal cleavage/methylation domain-containing protein
MKNSQSGFTLIEILVVIGIISLLAVALLPQVIQGRVSANMAADEANLRWHYLTFDNYRTLNGRLPPGGGHKFILRPWVDGAIEHNVENFNRYFSPQESGDEYKQKLEDEVGIANIWKTVDELSSEDTHYAGRAAQFKRRMDSGNEYWMATDNEFGATYKVTGTIIVLKGNGATEKLTRIRQLKEFYPENPDEEFVFEVGPNSPHEGLRKLEK